MRTEFHLVRPRLTLLAVIAILSACGGSDSGTAPDPSVPTAIAVNAGGHQSAMVASVVPVAPAVVVRDQYGSVLPGAAVTFVVATGGGSVTGGSATTNAAGIATVGSWTMGPIAGPNTLSASVASLAPVTFTATGTAGPPTGVLKVDGDTQTAVAGTAVSRSPSVKVVDAHGNLVGGASVAFVVSSGGGSVTGGTQTTNADGLATVGSWVLGPVAGSNTLIASVAGAPSATFTATGSVALIVLPSIAAAAPNVAVTFSAKDPQGTSLPVTWRVNGVPGGTSQSGTVTADGRYVAPPIIPTGDSVVVSAVLTPDTTTQRSATVFFVPDLTTRGYVAAFPRVVDMANPLPTRFLVVGPAAASQITYRPIAGAPVPLVDIGSNVFTFQAAASAAVAGYQTGTLHNFIGFLDYRDAAGGLLCACNLSVNVRDATVPNVMVTTVAADAQRSPFILNIRVDTITSYSTNAIRRRAIQLLGGDQFDFLAMIASTSASFGSAVPGNRVHIGLRNDVRGIGLSVFDNSAASGGAGRLRGSIEYPIDTFFDGAEGGTIHELGHSWINFASTDAVLTAGVPHWPASTMANGVMGMSIGGSNVGGQFPYTLVAVGSDSARISAAPASDRFTPLDLYLMGLLTPDSVPPVLVLSPSFVPNNVVNGTVLPARSYGIAEYIASQGTRVPAASASPRDFATATVLLTYGRLATASEMAFFDFAASRGETRVPLRSTSGRVTVDASGFYLATGGRATMRFRLP